MSESKGTYDYLQREKRAPDRAPLTAKDVSALYDLGKAGMSPECLALVRKRAEKSGRSVLETLREMVAYYEAHPEEMA